MSVTVVALLGGLLWFWWIPSQVVSRLEAAAARRGLVAEVGGVSIGLSEVELSTLVVRDESSALRITAGSVSTGAGVWALATSGTGAIRRLELADVRLSAQLDDPSLAETLRRLRMDRGPEAAEEPASYGRHVHAQGLEVLLRDEDGTLLEVTDGEATLLPEGIARVSLGPLSVARGDPDGADVERASLRAQRTDEGWRVAEASLEDARIRYRERAPEERSPMWERLRRHARLLGAFAEPEEGEDAPPPEDEAGGGGEEEPGADERGRVAQIVRVLEIVGPRLAPDALLRVEDLAVVATSDDGERSVLSDLNADVRATSERRYRLEGEGRPGRGGRLSWDLTVEPATLHAEGNVELSRLPFVLLLPLLPALPWHQPEDARVSGQLEIEGSGVGQTHLSGNATVEDLALSSERIAPSPVRRIRLSFDGEADWIPRERRLEVSRARLGLGGAAVDIAGSLEWPEDHYRVDVTATLPPTDCNVAVGAIPADLLGELTAFTFTGRLGGRVTARVDSRDLDATTLDIRVANGCQFETAPALADVRRFEGPFTHRVVEPDDTVFEMETGPGTNQWTPLAQISPFFIHAVLGHEDAGFFRHAGFSTASIRLALVRNLRAGRYVYGASTITMQLVKNVFLHREKTLARKVQEVLLTWWIESVMEKARILELYLNVIEYGPAVYGIRAAAEHYFGVRPADLTAAQSAYLATILPNPKAFHSQYEEDALPDRHRRRVERFLRTLHDRGRYDDEALEAGLEELAAFDFHQVGEPVGLPEPPRGGTAPLPIDGVWSSSIVDPWEEEDLPPDDPDPVEEEGEGWGAP